MKEITAYISNDGKVFQSQNECKDHEVTIKKGKELDTLRKNINSFLDESELCTRNETLEYLNFIHTQLRLLGYTLEDFIS